MKLITLSFWSFAQIFVFCDTSERVCTNFAAIDIYSDCNWYAFPMHIQHDMLIIIANSKRRVVLTGFGNIVCNRETFNKVIAIQIGIKM